VTLSVRVSSSGGPTTSEQSFKRAAEVADRLFPRRAIADRADAGAELSRGAPNTVLVLLDDAVHVNDTRQDIQYGARLGA
jgi:hypothetical protein